MVTDNLFHKFLLPHLAVANATMLRSSSPSRDSAQALSLSSTISRASKLCWRRDLNPQGLRHAILSRTCIPFHHSSSDRQYNRFLMRITEQFFCCDTIIINHSGVDAAFEFSSVIFHFAPQEYFHLYIPCGH